MRRLFLTILILNAVLLNLALADFRYRNLTFDSAIITEPYSDSYTYVNLTSSPTHLEVEYLNSNSGDCFLKSRPPLKVAPGASVEIKVACRFRQLGPVKEKIGTAKITEQKREYTLALSFEATVIKKVAAPVTDLKTVIKSDLGRCETVDFNKTQPLSSMPVLDQGETNLCYAYSASQLLEYEFKRRGLNRTFSPIDTGYVLKGSYSKPNDLDFGDTAWAMFSVLESGASTKECVDRVIKTALLESTMTLEEFLNILQKAYKLKSSVPFTAKGISNRLIETCELEELPSGKVERFITGLVPSFYDQLRSILKPCEKERKDYLNWPQVKVEYKDRGSNSEMKQYLDEFFNSGRPAGIALCSEILQGELKHRGVRIPNRDETEMKKTCGGHEVMATGRMKIHGQCNYLIRNSWGASWKNENFVCACKTKTKYYPDCSKAPKTDQNNKIMVGCWVPEKILLPNIYSLTGLK